METKNNTVLITGGATGIGFALAESLVKLGNKVIICGRRQEKLDEAKRKIPALEIKKCDVSKRGDCDELYNWIASNFKEMNVLINNAGVQNKIDLKNGLQDFEKEEAEIDINFKAQVYLTAKFMHHLLESKSSAIVNVSSGLGFVPMSIFPVYCATKAAMHSFSLSLRHQLKETQVKVFEVVPPAVHDTELKGKPVPKSEWSSSSAEVAEEVIRGLEADQYEIAPGAAKKRVAAAKSDFDKIFSEMNH